MRFGGRGKGVAFCYLLGGENLVAVAHRHQAGFTLGEGVAVLSAIPRVAVDAGKISGIGSKHLRNLFHEVRVFQLGEALGRERCPRFLGLLLAVFVDEVDQFEAGHGRVEGKASRNFRANRERLIEGEDFYVLDYNGVDEFRRSYPGVVPDAANRVILIDGDPWFVASDVCEALTIKDASMALSRLDADEKGASTIGTLGGPQEMAIINESGLYRLILTSRKPQAKRFKKWVTADVLPSIRKTVIYGVGPLTGKEKPRLAGVATCWASTAS